MKINKKKLGLNGASTAAAIATEEIARNMIDYIKQAMDIIVNQFEQSGAESIQTSGTGITDFIYGIEDLDGNGNLINQMDFSAVPQLYIDGGNKGFLIILGSEIIGGIAQLIAGKKTDNEYLKGAIKTGRRVGAGAGLGTLINAKMGLENMPYSISSPTLLGGPYSLVDLSKESQISSTDIEPIVNQGTQYLQALTIGCIATILGFELGLEFLDYAKTRPTKAVKERYHEAKLE